MLHMKIGHVIIRIKHTFCKYIRAKACLICSEICSEIYALTNPIIYKAGDLPTYGRDAGCTREVS